MEEKGEGRREGEEKGEGRREREEGKREGKDHLCQPTILIVLDTHTRSDITTTFLPQSRK